MIFLSPIVSGFPVRHRQHIDAERILQLRLLVKHVRQLVHIGILFQVNDDTDSLFGGLVGNIHNIRCLLRLHKGADII